MVHIAFSAFSKYHKQGIALVSLQFYLYRVKQLLILFLLFSSFRTTAQQAATYTELLKIASEINLNDSLLLSSFDKSINPVDTTTVKKWFSQVLSGSQNSKLKNRDFFLAGKITSNENFDLYILVEDKKKADTSVMQVVHLVTTKKDGHYIASFKAAITGTKKRSSYNTSSWLYKGFNIVQDSKIITSTASLADVTQYRINNTGRFIMSSNF